MALVLLRGLTLALFLGLLLRRETVVGEALCARYLVLHEAHPDRTLQVAHGLDVVLCTA